MNNRFLVLLAALALVTATTGCKEQAPAPEAKPAAQQPAATPQGKTGTVVETMNSGGYTYVKVDTGSETFWAAAPELVVAVGDPVVVPPGMEMKEHHSSTLDRDFDVIYFVDSIMVGGEQAAMNPANSQMPEGHPPIEKSTDVEVSGIQKADGGKTVVEVFTNKQELVGKEVTVRGKVVKFSPEIMGKNWIHLQDGTGDAGTNDLTVTTDAVAKIGDTVLITGLVSTDKDFGYGYKYDVILEDAKVVVE